MEPNVQPEPVGYQLTAAELRRIADALDTLPPGDHAPFTSLSFLPAGSGASRAEKVAAVDALALALFGDPGKPEKIGSDWYHLIRRTTNNVHLAVQEILPAVPDERDAELERLRAEVEQLRAERTPDFVDGPCEDPDCPNASWPHLASSDLAEPDPTGLNYGRGDEAQDPQPVAGRVPPHLDGRTGEVVDASEGEPVTRYFSFGHGQTDPDTGADLLNRYVTVVAPTAQACREAMFASRYGREWAFEYIPGTPQADEWIPRWNEHERIDAMPASAE